MILAILFWGTIALIFGAVWFGTLLLFIASRFSRTKILRWLGFLPFVGMNLCVLWLVASLYYFTTPPKVFESEFGFAPTPDVRELQSQTWQFGDSGTTYLKFKATPQTIERIAMMGLQSKPVSQANRYTFMGSNLPQWWKPRSQVLTHLYTKTNRLKDFGHEEEMLCYNERTQQAYYSFTGID